jgi:glycosyltransferase involved in cell wall biosynthesis
MKALLVDPSLFTGPYDAALSQALVANGVSVAWALRGARPGETVEVAATQRRPIFYPVTDGSGRARWGAAKRLKGVEHVIGLVRLLALARSSRADIVHFQWSPLPGIDRLAIQVLQRRVPVVMTVHDSTPFNGADVSRLQREGLERLMRVVDHLIVHTQNARRMLVSQGIDDDRISVIPHGPLPLSATPRPVARAADRTRIVLFGRLQDYKGVDLLVEATGRLAPAVRDRLEIIVAGEPLIDLDTIFQRIAMLGIDRATLEIRPGRLGDQDMADLLGSADAFVYPYRAIETSGVFYLTAGLGKWTIASALGSFNDALSQSPPAGRLVPPGDVDALAQALAECAGGAPVPAKPVAVADWTTIGQQTTALYQRLITQREAP